MSHLCKLPDASITSNTRITVRGDSYNGNVLLPVALQSFNHLGLPESTWMVNKSKESSSKKNDPSLLIEGTTIAMSGLFIRMWFSSYKNQFVKIVFHYENKNDFVSKDNISAEELVSFIKLDPRNKEEDGIKVWLFLEKHCVLNSALQGVINKNKELWSTSSSLDWLDDVIESFDS
jgi:hypothetical protein